MAYMGTNEQLRNALRHISERASTGETDRVVCAEAAARIEALERQVKAADALAELLDLPDQSDGLSGRYHYDWHKVDTALAAYRATKEGGA